MNRYPNQQLFLFKVATLMELLRNKGFQISEIHKYFIKVSTVNQFGFIHIKPFNETVTLSMDERPNKTFYIDDLLKTFNANY